MNTTLAILLAQSLSLIACILLAVWYVVPWRLSDQFLIENLQFDRHANEVRKRSRTHLAHHVAAMNLHRHKRDGQHSGDLLIEKPPDNECEYLALPPSETQVTRIECSNFGTPPTNGTVTPESFVYCTN